MKTEINPDGQVEKLYGKTHDIRRVYGDCHVELSNLKFNQSVCWGDGKTFYYLLTENPNK